MLEATDDLLTSAEAAASLGVSVRTLERMRYAGEITYVEKGRGPKPRIFYTEDAIQECKRRQQPRVVQAKKSTTDAQPPHPRASRAS